MVGVQINAIYQLETFCFSESGYLSYFRVALFFFVCHPIFCRDDNLDTKSRNYD